MSNFLYKDSPLIVSMCQGDNSEEIISLIRNSVAHGADAVGVQLCRLKKEFKSDDNIKNIFSCSSGKPYYITNYRYGINEGKTDDELAKDILHYATLGGDVYDVMGDIFDRSENEITYNAQAIKKQKQLIDNLHKMGKQVLMSSHTFKFMDCDEVIKIAKAQESRGADVVKIVAASNSDYECLENLKTSLKLKEELNVPFLFLSVGEYSRVHRLIGTHYGSCMWLCVDRYDAFATPAQPLIETIKNLRDNIILS